ncbi:peptidoglycan-binding protein [Kitasatospora sp. NPDC051853]|uniref:peptidoglycan-binding protein n=1 Tax=Kitasatospora sp. NPDC051853 TaxID=3364058 RepID=UPI0037A53F2E
MGWNITVDQVLAAARADLGLGESPDGSNHNVITDAYGIGDGPWCGMAVWDWFNSGGVDLRRVLTREWAWTPSGAMAGKKAGLWHQGPEGRQPGDIVFYKVPGGASYFVNHVSLYEGDGVSIDGNWRNVVQRVVHPAGTVVGYIRPPYAQPQQPPSTPAPKPYPPFRGATLGRGDVGPDVRTAQQRLKDRGWSIAVDGDFGPATEKVVRAYQAEKGLDVDGLIGPLTWASLWTAPVTP